MSRPFGAAALQPDSFCCPALFRPHTPSPPPVFAVYPLFFYTFYAAHAYAGDNAVGGGGGGKSEQAMCGTLFLDEVGDLPLEAKAQCVRVLQDGCVMRLGECQPRRVSVRILSATNIDSHKAIAENRFRKDLFYRLASASLALTSLRVRYDDIWLPVRYFVN